MVSFNHHFQNCSCFPPPVTSFRTFVWNWTQYITYLDATPFLETRWSWFYVRLLHAVFEFRTFDYVQLFKCSISERSIEFDWQNFVVIKFDYQTQSNNRMIGVRLSLITERSIDYAGNMGKQSSLAICCSHGLQLTVRSSTVATNHQRTPSMYVLRKFTLYISRDFKNVAHCRFFVLLIIWNFKFWYETRRGGVTTIYGIYRYVLPWKVWFSISLLWDRVYKSGSLGLE